MNEALKILIAVVLSNLVAQVLKVIISKVKYKEAFDWKDFFLTGGMPSSHTSMVATLCLMTYLEEGFSLLFTASLTLSLIVIRDALGVRHSVGEEGKAINKIIDEMNKSQKNGRLKPVNYSLGHTPSDVSAGAILGVIIALAAHFLL